MAIDKYLNLAGTEHLADYIKKRLQVVTTIPANPEDEDIVLYKGATTVDFLQGSVYMYKEGIDYYAWSDGTDIYYTLSETPTAGDATYEDTSGTASSYTVDAYDAINDEVTINSLIYARDTAGDVNTSKWVLQDTSIILNGIDKTGNEASFYAPTASGTEGQVLVSNGENADPSWASFTGYCPTIIDQTLYFTYGTMPEVENTSIIFNLD